MHRSENAVRRVRLRGIGRKGKFPLASVAAMEIIVANWRHERFEGASAALDRNQKKGEDAGTPVIASR
jgi:hypothetical protein